MPASKPTVTLIDLPVKDALSCAIAPAAGSRQAAAAKQARGTKVVVIDPRRTATCEIADLHLAIRPTALHWAVSPQRTEIVTTLLEAGANPNVPDNDGYTPLHDVAEMGDCPPARTMLEVLLAAGADPSRQEKNGRTPSELAESMGYTVPSF